jgi:hypothetical protein
MTENVVLIRDSKARAFFVTIWTTSTATDLKFWNCGRTRYQVGDWETNDNGFLRPNSGDAFLTNRKSPVDPGYGFSGTGDATYVDLYLGEFGSVDGHDDEHFKWGMALYQYTDGFGGVQDSGKGEVRQNWVQTLHPGEIWWKKTTVGDLMGVLSERDEQATWNQPVPSGIPGPVAGVDRRPVQTGRTTRRRGPGHSEASRRSDRP